MKAKKYYQYDEKGNGAQITDTQTIEILRLYEKKIRNASPLKQAVLQETAIKLMSYNNIGEGKIENLWNKIERNTTVDKWRNSEKDNHITELWDDYTAEQRFTLGYCDYRDIVQYICSRLTNAECQIFAQYHVAGKKQDVVAKKMGVSQQTISNHIRRLNAKLHRMKIKELYRIDYVAPVNRDKKMPQYRDAKPVDAAPVQREQGPWRGKVCYIYSMPVSQKKKYENRQVKYVAPKKVHNMEQLPDNFVPTEYFAPTRPKSEYDCIDITPVVYGKRGVRYVVRKRSISFQGDLNNRYGACYNYGKMSRFYQTP